ncbi:MAG: hypothetical protein VM34scaffold347_49 [Phage 66_12]|jgi:hypothetical protein|nr:MAG: hypothetical protein VM34scaffold347_49 [Phage 66_12]
MDATPRRRMVLPPSEVDRLLEEIALIDAANVRSTQRAINAENDLKLILDEVFHLFNPSADVEDQSLRAVAALQAVQSYIVSVRCTCGLYSALMNGGKACPRCKILGRFRNEPVPR